jgi:hypothetical protein
LALLTGVVALGLLVVRPEDGHAIVQPAPSHMTQAHGHMMMLAEAVDEADTLDEAREQNIRERVKKEQEVERRVEEADRTLLEEAHGVQLERRLTPEQDEELVDEDITDRETQADTNGQPPEEERDE